MMEQNEIDEKLLLYLLDEADEIVREDVEIWLAESERNREYFREFQRVHLALEWSVYAREVQPDFNTFRRKLKKNLNIRVWYSVAAVLVLALSMGGVLFWRTAEVPVQMAQEISIQPGKPQAILVLSSGEKVEMGMETRQLEERDGTSVRVNETGSISYQAVREDETLEKDAEKVMNRLLIPRGGEFNLTLSDGTRVWLNAETELLYPVRFNGKQRVVYLKGEAYFDVAKNKEMPFIVQMEDDVAVRVYGTEFNVNTYDGVETVLVTGSVSMNQGGKEVLLKPNQKGIFDKSKDGIKVEDVDVLPYVAWKDGDFIFRNESLGSIMDKLSRWYGLDVFYQNGGLRDVHLSGNLKRYKDVQELFRSFEKISDARFKVKGNTVFISKL
ncbi:FecR domain-containing protein [Butyricimonas hominis]|uniref:FecR domain-containing protein n=1 Tax=Butyricimonas TaxID=574697 RepID=UPI00351657CB